MSYQAGFDAVMKTAGLGQRVSDATVGLPALFRRVNTGRDVLQEAQQRASHVVETMPWMKELESVMTDLPREALAVALADRNRAARDLALGAGTLGAAGAGYALTRPKEASLRQRLHNATTGYGPIKAQLEDVGARMKQMHDQSTGRWLVDDEYMGAYMDAMKETSALLHARGQAATDRLVGAAGAGVMGTGLLGAGAYAATRPKEASLKQRALNATLLLPDLLKATSKRNVDAYTDFLRDSNTFLQTPASAGSPLDPDHARWMLGVSAAAVERFERAIPMRNQALKDLAMGTAGLGTLGTAGAYAATRPKEAATGVEYALALGIPAIAGGAYGALSGDTAGEGLGRIAGAGIGGVGGVLAAGMVPQIRRSNSAASLLVPYALGGLGGAAAGARAGGAAQNALMGTRPKEAAFPVFDRIAPAFKALKGPPKPDLTSWKHVPENPIPGGFPGETRRTVAAQNAWKDLEDYGNNNNIEKRLREMYAILARGGASG